MGGSLGDGIVSIYCPWALRCYLLRKINDTQVNTDNWDLHLPTQAGSPTVESFRTRGFCIHGST